MRNPYDPRVWLTALAIAVTAGAPRAQSAPLPQEMIAVFGMTAGPAAATLRYPQQHGEIHLRVTFNNEPEHKYVDLRFTYGTETTESGQTTLRETTAFQPTAVCARAGTTDTLYVAGWDPRLGAVSVERWTLSGAQVLGPPITEGWTPEDAIGVAPAFTEPQIQRTLLFTCSSLAPILDLSFHPFQDELLLLERTTQTARAVYAYPAGATDPRCTGLVQATAGNPAVLLDSSQVSGLAGMNSFWEGLHPQAGFVVYLTARTMIEGLPDDPDSMPILVLRDAATDGQFEIIEASTFGTLFTTFPYGEFDFRYS